MFAFYNSTCFPGEDFLQQLLDVVKWSSVDFLPIGWTFFKGKWDCTGHWTMLNVCLMFSPSCLWFVLGRGGPQIMPEWMFHLAPHGQPLYHTFLLATWLSRKEKNTFITTEGLSYNPSLYNYLCLHDMHFSSCKELLGWQHNDFTFSQHENSIPLLLERWDVHAREQNLVPHMQ